MFALLTSIVILPIFCPPPSMSKKTLMTMLTAVDEKDRDGFENESLLPTDCELEGERKEREEQEGPLRLPGGRAAGRRRLRERERRRMVRGASLAAASFRGVRLLLLLLEMGPRVKWMGYQMERGENSTRSGAKYKVLM
jgi:hypothetical protein